MLMKTRRKKLMLTLDALKVESLLMPAAAKIEAVTTSNTCPTRCDTDFECTQTLRDMCTQWGNACGTDAGCV